MNIHFRISRLTAVLFLILIFASAAVVAQRPDPILNQLREQFGEKYMQPAAHFALAKYYLDRGDKLQAFYVIEYARKYRFEEKDFDAAYTTFFGNNMAEPPDNAKAAFEKAFELAKENKFDEAEEYLQTALQFDDRSFFINAWIGRYFFKTRSNAARALPYYFKAYFLYPHAYETEFVESRIRNIAVADAEAMFPYLLNNGGNLTRLARSNDPILAGMAMEQMVKSWKPEYLKTMVECLNDDDSGNRWYAFMAIQKYAGVSLNTTIDSMLIDKDPRKRGLAAYAIIERPQQSRFEIVEKMLADPAELVRFDAISALVLRGGATGKQVLRRYQKVEKESRLKRLITKALVAKK